jgi:hypothetical protein
MLKRSKLLISGVGFALALSISGPLGAGENATQTETMHRFSDKSVVANAQGKLTRMDHGIYMAVDTVEMTPGHAVTMWFVLFNKPGNCSGGECGEDDIFNLDAKGKFIENADGSPPMNMKGIEAASISLHRADGLIIDVGGAANFRGHLPIGDTTEAVFGHGLIDAHAAEVHAVIRSHKKVIPGKASEMVSSMDGGCAADWPNEPCEDLQFAVFKPAM